MCVIRSADIREQGGGRLPNNTVQLPARKTSYDGNTPHRVRAIQRSSRLMRGGRLERMAFSGSVKRLTPCKTIPGCGHPYLANLNLRKVLYCNYWSAALRRLKHNTLERTIPRQKESLPSPPLRRAFSPLKASSRPGPFRSSANVLASFPRKVASLDSSSSAPAASRC